MSQGGEPPPKPASDPESEQGRDDEAARAKGKVNVAPLPMKPPGIDQSVEVVWNKFVGLLRNHAKKQKKDSPPSDEIEETLAELESLTWRSLPRGANLEIVLRRSYEETVRAAKAATVRADRLGDRGSNTLLAAVVIAILGWLSTVACVVGGTFWNAKTPGIKEIWPALAATSGAVFLLLGIATLAFKFAQRSHERATNHHSDAISTREVETAVRLIMMTSDLEFDGGMSAVRDFSYKMLEASRSRAKTTTAPVEISPLPDGTAPAVAKIFERAVEGITAVAKDAIGVAKKATRKE